MLILSPDMKEISMHGRLKKKENDKAEAISADSEAAVTTVMHL